VNLRKGLTPESIIALFAAAVLLFGALVWADKTPGITKTDFSVTYVGARMVHLGLGPQLYDLSAQAKVKESLDIGGKTLIYEHPPFEALLLSLLGGLPYRTAYLVWGLLSTIIWLVLPFLLRPYLPAPGENLSYTLLWLAFAPLWITLYVGQSSLVMLLLYSISFVCLKRGQQVAAGLALGLALFKFQFAVPFICIFFLRGKWKVIQGFLTAALMLGVASLATVGWRGISAYVHLLTTITAHPDNLSYGAAVDMATIQGFVHGTVGGFLNRFLSLLCVAVISALVIFWTAHEWNRREQMNDCRSDDLMFAASIVVSLITGFHMFTHDLSPMLLSMFLVAAHTSSSNKTAIRFTLLACLAVFWFAPIYFLLLSWHYMFLLAPVLMAFAVGAIKLAANLEPAPFALQRSPVESLTGVLEA
jgi:hypothetical protein